MWNSMDFYIPMIILKGFLISCKTVWGRAIKKWLFSGFGVNIWGKKLTQSFWNWFSYQNIKLEEQLLSTTFLISIPNKKLYLVKMCPIFDDFAISCLTRYPEILSGCSLVCKNQWESACHTTDFHNRHHINVHTVPENEC